MRGLRARKNARRRKRMRGRRRRGQGNRRGKNPSRIIWQMRSWWWRDVQE